MVNTRTIAQEYRLSHWTEVMRDRTSSGLTIKAYCEREGIHQNVYHYWQRKLRQATATALVSATVTPSILPTGEQPSSLEIPQGWALCATSAETPHIENSIQLEIGKVKVSASPNTDMEYLKKVCQMLVTLC